MARKNAGASGAYTISSPGISTRIDASAPNLGAALSKAQNLAVRLQRELRETDEEQQSIYVRRIGRDPVARVDVLRDVIATAVWGD